MQLFLVGPTHPSIRTNEPFLLHQGALLLAAGTSAAPPLHVEPTTTAAPETTAAPLPAVTTAAPEAAITTAAPILATTAVPTVEAEDIITGFTSPPEAPRSSEEVTTAAPVAAVTTATPVFTTIAAIPAVPTTTQAPPPPPPTQPPRLSGKQREALISHLGNIDLRNTDKLVLTPRQRQAIAEELEYQQLGLQPFTDPTPWQLLSREQQTEFYRKFLALPRHLQE